MPQRKSPILLLACLVFCFTAKPEEITLKSGQKFKADILNRDGQSIKVSLNGAPVTYYLEDVAAIDGKPITSLPDNDPQVKELIEQTQKLLASDKFAQAADILRARINSGIKNAEIYYYLGEAERLLKNYDSAINSYQESINLDPADYSAFLGMGLAYRDNEDKDKALIFLNKAKELKPDEPKVFFAIGNFYVKTQEYARAEENLKKAVELNYAYWIARFNLANVYTALGRYQEAVDQYWIYIKNAGEDPQAYLNLSQAYIGLKDNEDALAALLTARELYQKEAGSENVVKWINLEMIKIQSQTASPR